MVPYNKLPVRILRWKNVAIPSFITEDDASMDKKTVESFSEEWLKFSHFNEKELAVTGTQYFDIVNEMMLDKDSVVLDAGCGTGRWSKYLAPRVKYIEAVDPSDAVYPASMLTKDTNNIRITQATIESLPFDDETFDFVLCLGVLHHIPDTQKALDTLIKKLRKGKYCLLYLYYNFENRGFVIRLLFACTDIARRVICILPPTLKKIICDIIAIFVYLPIIFIVKMVKNIFPDKKWHERFPLSYYSDKSFNIIRNDALDRFGTPLEKRYSRSDIRKMMGQVGLREIVFSDSHPFWHVSGKKI